MSLLTLTQRYDRVNNEKNIIIVASDMSVHLVSHITMLRDCVVVHTEGNLIYQDTDVFTYEELYQAELEVDTLLTELGLKSPIH
jgi:ABC-type Na+ transport system ATPase subunit NatA